ncbi:MAG: DUF2784 domain-containing protein [Acidobacteriota bacterium]|nr:DUF2784 domain-containing protein [Acidobacteriota bacterium]
MIWRILADLVLVFHFCLVMFAVAGGLLVLYKRWVAWLHVPFVLWAAIVNLAGWVCPLTPMENRFRLNAGQSGYEGGFVVHYIMPLVYPGGMTRNWELAAGVSVFVWNILLYALIIHRFKRRKKKTSGYE